MSDVEGHWDYFCAFVALSRCLSFRGVGDAKHFTSPSDCELDLADGWQFIFGGDSCDKGPGTIRFCEALVSLKRRHPRRVHLILGNRDINKMRLSSDLSQAEVDRMVDAPIGYWVPEKARVSQREFLSALNEDGGDIRQRQTKANKLRYMLDVEMGARGELDFRRSELAMLKGVEASEISDAAVVESYEKSVQPGGFMREYLLHAQLAAIIGDRLFVHGQVIGNQFPHGQVEGADEDNVACCVGVVPGHPKPVANVREWVEKLNAWGRQQVEDWIANPTWGRPPQEPTVESWQSRGGSELMCYGTPSTKWPSVVYCRFLDEQSMPMVYPDALVQRLCSSDIRYVVVGHTPHGNCPTVIQSKYSHCTAVTTIMADTSYSHLGANAAFLGDNRGGAVSGIWFDSDGCHVSGVTEREQALEYTVAPDSRGDQYVGRVHMQHIGEKDYFIKAKLTQQHEGGARAAAEPSYLLAHVAGFAYEYLEQSRGQLESETLESNESLRTVLSPCSDVLASSGSDAIVILKYMFGDLLPAAGSRVSTGAFVDRCSDSQVQDAWCKAFPHTCLKSTLQSMQEGEREDVDLDDLGRRIERPSFGKIQAHVVSLSAAIRMSSPPSGVARTTSAGQGPSVGLGLHEEREGQAASAELETPVDEKLSFNLPGSVAQ